MTLAVIYPPGTVLPPELPRCRDRELRLIEAWPGSVQTVAAFEDECSSVPHQLFGFVLDFAGELPADRVGILFVVRPNEVAAVRAYNERPTRWERTYARAEAPHPWPETFGAGATPPPYAGTTCRIVEAWPGSIDVTLGRDGNCPQLGGVAHSTEGDLPEGLIGNPVMLHFGDCAICRGIPECDCFELTDDNQATGRRPR